MTAGFFSFSLSPLMRHPNGSPAASSAILDATNKMVGWMHQMREAATITAIAFDVTNVTGTSPTYKASLQGIDASGDPDGIVLGGVSPASATFAPGATGYQTITLDNSYAATRGEFFSVVIDHDSGTIDGTNKIHVLHGFGNCFTQGFPIAKVDSGAGWAEQVNNHPGYGLRAGTQRYGFPITSFQDRNTSTAGHREAVKFTVPAGLWDTFKIVGVEAFGFRPTVGNGTFVLGLWDASSALQTITIDSSPGAMPAVNIHNKYFFDEATLSTLSAGTVYYVGLEQVGVTQVQVKSAVTPAADDMNAFRLGTAAVRSNYNGTSWSDTATERPLVRLLLSDITAPAAGAASTPVVFKRRRMVEG